MLTRVLTILFFLLLMMHDSNAQLCQGSLGDPIINTTFGHGANPGSSLSAATTNYQYVAYDCPVDGSYTVRNTTTSCFDNSWHNLSSDHTGDPGGYFMLVNASFQPSAFFLDTVRGLCGNSTYEFAAWVMNVLLSSSCTGGGIQPNLTFSIEKTDGTILQSHNTGDISAASVPTWKQYGFFFTTPAAGSDIVLRIINNAPGGCGNDLALDDITFRPCGPQITNTVDGIPATPQSFCEGPGHQFQLNCTVSGGFINPVFQWQARSPLNNTWTDIAMANNSSVGYVIGANAPPGIYQLRLAVAEAGNLGSLQCRIYSEPFSFTINANPVTTAINNGPVCEGNTAILTATGGSQYTWAGPDLFAGSGSPLPLVNVHLNQAGKYYVTVGNAAGCVHTDSTTIAVNPAPSAVTGFSNTSICLGDSVQLTASGGSTYVWLPFTGLSAVDVFNPKASPAETTLYKVVVANQFSCTDTAAVTVNIIQPPKASAGPDKAILEGQSIQLTGSINGSGNNYSWSPPTHINDIHSLHPFVDPPADTSYILNVLSNFGCGSFSDTVFVKVYKKIFVPNAFSPNGDGTNDTWNIPALAAYPFFEVIVFDRYGQMVFQTKNNLKPWDGKFKGKPLPVGVYIYFINVGISQDLFKGTVLIIR
ncbi:MAG: gliding motility-associated C-terminal domain-containing protein [Ferruginibacter sp.]